jgi:hypothetical protein
LKQLFRSIQKVVARGLCVRLGASGHEIPHLMGCIRHYTYILECMYALMQAFVAVPWAMLQACAQIGAPH